MTFVAHAGIDEGANLGRIFWVQLTSTARTCPFRAGETRSFPHGASGTEIESLAPRAERSRSDTGGSFTRELVHCMESIDIQPPSPLRSPYGGNPNIS